MRRPAVGDTSNRPGYDQQGGHGSLTLGCHSHLNSPPWSCPARNDREPCILYNSAMPRASGIRTETGSQGHKFTNVLVFKSQTTPQFSCSSLCQIIPTPPLLFSIPTEAICPRILSRPCRPLRNFLSLCESRVSRNLFLKDLSKSYCVSCVAVRDEWENKKADIESQLETIFGFPIKFNFNPSVVWAYAEASGASDAGSTLHR